MRNWIEKEQPEEDTLQSLKKDLKIDDFICSLLLQREVNSLNKAQKFFIPKRPTIYIRLKSFSTKYFKSWRLLRACFITKLIAHFREKQHNNGRY